MKLFGNGLERVSLIEDCWLTRVMGEAAFKVTLDHSSAAVGSRDELTLCSQLSDHVARQPAAFYYAKVATNDIGTVRLLTAAGLYVVDVNVTLTRRRPTEVIGSTPVGVTLGDVHPRQHGEVLDIAESCFQYSRFHLDPLVPGVVANRVKREWVHSYLRRERGDRLFVAAVDREVAGFLAAMSTEQDDCRALVIDLMGVSRTYQGKGVGRALVEHTLSHYKDRMDVFRVGTQVTNVPSLRLYQKCGFSLLDSQYVMHMHVRSGKILTATS